MPPLEWAPYIVNYLFEIGPVLPAGMGSGPITASEIEAWQRLLGLELQPWEVRLLLRLSREYLSESHSATERGRPAPWQSGDVQPERIIAAIDQRMAIRNLAAL